MSSWDVCLITQLHPSMNPRLVKEADALVEAGLRVAVIAPNFSEWGRRADEEFSDRSWRIVERPEFGPMSPRSVRFKELFRRLFAGVATNRLGVKHPAVVRAAWHPVAPELISAAKRHRARLYVAHLPTALPAAAIVARHYDSICAYDAEDFHLGELDDSSKGQARKALCEAIERRYLPLCSYVTAASPLIADAYRDAYGISRPNVVLNVFPLSHAPDVPTVAGSASPGPSIYWFSQTIGPRRGIECAISAIGLATSRPHLYLRGNFHPATCDWLRVLTASANVTERVHILPPGPPSEMERLASIYDLGISGEPGTTTNNQLALGNKLFTYLLAGLPILMSDTRAHRAIAGEFESAAYLYRAEDPQSLADAIDDILLSSKHLSEARRHAFNLGQIRFNWDYEKSKLLRVVNEALEARR